MANKQDLKVIAAAMASEDGAYIAKLAESFYYGRGRDKSLKTALQLWDRAVELGDADALYYSGVCYYYGDGRKRNKEAAFDLWEKAAQQGHAGAKLSLETLRV